jgi:hypothetical protein
MTSGRDDSFDMLVPAFLNPSISTTPGAHSRRGESYSYLPYSIDAADDDPPATKELRARLAAAEAELKVSKLRLELIEAQKRKTMPIESVENDGHGSIDEPHLVN